MRRRDALFWGGLVAVAISIPPLLRRWNSELVFEPITGQSGFRRLIQGSAGTVSPAFVGLTTSEETAANAALPDDLCAYLFRGFASDKGRVPVIAFSDYFCPYCATLERRLARLQDDGLPIDLHFQPLPILGDRSQTLARVAFAAKHQESLTAVHSELMTKGLRPGPAALRDLAERYGLDADQLTDDVNSAKTAREVQTALAIGRALGIFGTPATLVGRTLVVGAIDDRMIERLVALEASEPFVCA